MGTVVGILSILTLLCAWRTEPRRWVKSLALLILLGVITQGILGGLRVIWIRLDLAIVHACIAQAIFCLAILMTTVTSRWWLQAPNLCGEPAAKPGQWLAGLACFTVAAIYMQLIAGAVMRHNGAGLAIPDFPLAYGRLLPPTTNQEVDHINALRPLVLDLPPVTLQQILYNYLHRAGALLSLIAVLALTLATLRTKPAHSQLRRPALWLLGLTLIQIALGGLVELLRKPADVATTHVAAGAAVLAVSFLLAIRTLRLYGPMRHKPAAHPVTT